MENINIFEVATRNKIRFNYKGLITTEDLWDLSLSELDSIFGKLKAQEKEINNQESLLDNNYNKNTILTIKLEIVKYIFSVKKLEEDNNKLEKENKLKKQKIMEILKSKQDENLKSLTVEELQKMLDNM